MKTIRSHCSFMVSRYFGFLALALVFCCPLASRAASPVIFSASDDSAPIQLPYTYTITASNSPTQFTAANLPAGLTLNPTTGVISGTPTVAGTSAVVLGASNADGSGSLTLNLKIYDSTSEFPSTVGDLLPRSLTVLIGAPSAQLFKILGTNGTTVTIDNLPAGFSYDSTTGSVSGSAQGPPGIFTVSFTATKGAVSSKFSPILMLVNPSAGGPVIDQTGVGGVDFHVGDSVHYQIVLSSGTAVSYGAFGLLSNLSINTSTGLITGTAANPDDLEEYHLFAITATDSLKRSGVEFIGFYYEPDVEKQPPPTPKLLSSPTLKATTGVLFSHTIVTDQDGLVTLQVLGTGDGIAFSPNIQTLAGTPARAANLTLQMRYIPKINVDFGEIFGRQAQVYQPIATSTIRLAVTDPAPVIQSPLSARGAVGTAFTYGIAAPFAYGFSATGLPAGLQIDVNSGMISGTPSTIGVYNPTLKATGVSGSDTKTLALTVGPAFTSPPTPGSPLGVSGQPTTFSASGPGAITWDFGDGTTGSGNSVTHLFSSPGTFEVKATLTDAATGVTTTQTIVFVVGNAPLNVTGGTFKLGKSDSIRLTGMLPIAQGSVIEGQNVSVNIGGNIQPFKLSAGGSGKSDASSIKVAFKKGARKGPTPAQTAKFTLTLKGALAASLKANPPLDAKGYPTAIPVTVQFNGAVFYTIVNTEFVTKGKTTTAKL